MSAISSASSILPSGFRPNPSQPPLNPRTQSAPAQTTPVPIQTPSNPTEPPNLPAMKRPRGHASRRLIETPALRGLEIPPNGREMKKIEPNGEQSEPVRRSTRLKSTSSTSSKSIPRVPRDKRSTRSRSATSSASGATGEIDSPSSQEAQMQVQADDWLRHVVRRCGRAYRALSLYRCQEALREIDALPVEVQTSAWALGIVARSFYEIANYVLVSLPSASLRHLTSCEVGPSFFFVSKLKHLGTPSIQVSLQPRTLPPPIDRALQHTPVASRRCPNPLPPRSTPHVNRPRLAASMDRFWQLLFFAKGSRGSYPVLQACDSPGSGMCVRVDFGRVRGCGDGGV